MIECPNREAEVDCLAECKLCNGEQELKVGHA
jgi:hypothetical protein